MQSGNTQSVTLTGSDQVIAAFPGVIYMGFTLRETAGSTATLRIWDSKDSTFTNNTLLDTISLTANESAREYYPEGLHVTEGIYIDILSGAVEGSLRLIQGQRRDLLDS